jgi:peptide deformylase
MEGAAMVYKVVQLGHPALRQRSAEVDLKQVQSAKFQKLIDDMFATMRAYEGVGIAAPQIGLPIAVFCVEVRGNRRYPDMPNIPVYTVINPKLTITNKSKLKMMEGCLSIPDLRGDTPRAKAVRLEGFDRHGKPLDFEAKGFHARILQHEYDHLQGKVYLDRVEDRRSLCYTEYL